MLPPVRLTLASQDDVALASVARGDVLYRGASAWRNLAAGVAGLPLLSGGPVADPVYGTLGIGGGGTGAITAAAARTALGLAIGADVLAPNGSGTALTALATGSTTARTLAARFAATFDVKDYGAVLDGTTNDGPALQAALNAAFAAGGGTVFIPAGTLKLATGVSRDFTGMADVAIRGVGAASKILVAVGGAAFAIVLANLYEVLVEGVAFWGTTGTGSDCLSALRFLMCWKAVVRDCGFYNLASRVANGSLLSADSTLLAVEHVAFRACGGGGAAGSDGCILVTNSLGLVCDDLWFIDTLTFGATNYNRGFNGLANAWIRHGTCSPASDANNCGTVFLRGLRCDEGATTQLLIDPTAGANRVPAVVIQDFNSTGQSVAGAVAIRAKNVDKLIVERANIGYATTTHNNAVYATDCASVLLRDVRLTGTMDLVQVDGPLSKKLHVWGGAVSASTVTTNTPIYIYEPAAGPPGLPTMTTAVRDALTGQRLGAEIYNTTTGQVNIFNGSTWDALAAGGGGSAGIAVGNAIGSGAASRVLYADASQNLAESPALLFDGTTLTVGQVLASQQKLLLLKGGRNDFGAFTIWDLDSFGNFTWKNFLGSTLMTYDTTNDRFAFNKNVFYTGQVAFNGNAPLAKPSITGSRGANAALASLLTALSNYGLVADNTT